jgi:thioredoxin 1
MAATVIDSKNFEEQVKSGVTLVDFWAPWCGPCKTQLPIVEDLASELEGTAKVAKVNVDEEGDLASKFGITGIPTLLIFKDGEPVDKLVGLQSKDQLKTKILKLTQ